MPESRDERPNYLIVLTKGKYYMMRLSHEQMDAFWHVWNTTIKQVGKPAGYPRSTSS